MKNIQKINDNLYFSGTLVGEYLQFYRMLKGSPFLNKIIKSEKGILWTNSEIYVLNDPIFYQKFSRFQELGDMLDEETIFYAEPEFGVRGILLFKAKDRKEVRRLEDFFNQISEDQNKKKVYTSRLILKTDHGEHLAESNEYIIIRMEKYNSLLSDSPHLIVKREDISYAEEIKATPGIEGWQYSSGYIDNGDDKPGILIPSLQIASNFKTIENLI